MYGFYYAGERYFWSVGVERLRSMLLVLCWVETGRLIFVIVEYARTVGDG